MKIEVHAHITPLRWGYAVTLTDVYPNLVPGGVEIGMQIMGSWWRPTEKGAQRLSRTLVRRRLYRHARAAQAYNHPIKENP